MRPTSYPPLPQLAPRQPSETAEAFGLRALAFAVEHGPELMAGQPEALALADHVFPIVISARGLMAATLDRLAETQRRIRASQRRAAAIDAAQAGEPRAQDAPPAAQAAPGGASGGGGGAKVPRRPIPPRGGPGAALQAPAQPARQPVAIADPF